MQQLKRIRTIWLWVVLVFLALFVLSSGMSRSRSWSPLEQLVVEVVAPLQRLAKGTIDGTEGIWLKYFSLVGVHNENLRLRRELDTLRLQHLHYDEMLSSARRLEKLLQFQQSQDHPVLIAQVIGWDPTGWFRSVIIGKGAESQLHINMPVINERGVVGRVVSVSAHYAKVLLMADQKSAVDCIVQRSREKGIVKGLSYELCRLDYVVKTGDVSVGDRVVTSGLGGVFPKGIPVGDVTEVEDVPWQVFKEIKVRPVVDFSKLEEVVVVLKEDPLARELKKRD